MKNLKEDALNTAVQNGLYENARTNAKTLLTTFFASAYDLNQYTIVFQDS